MALTTVLTLTNTGTGRTADLTVASPVHLGWMQAAPAILPALNPGESAPVTVTLAPPVTTPLGIYQDLVRISGDSELLRDAAMQVRVVGVTRTLVMSVTDGLVPVPDAAVRLTAHDQSVHIYNGITRTVHSHTQATTGQAGTAALLALEVGSYDYLVWAAGYGAASGVLTVTGGSGAQHHEVQLEGLPRLQLDPLYPKITVRAGETGSVDVVVRNVGTEAANGVQVAPFAQAPDWLSTGVVGAADVLSAGEALSVTLFARPPLDQATPAIYQEYVEVTAANAATMRFALTVYVGTWTTGTVQMHVTDGSALPLGGATVTLISTTPSLLVTSGMTQTHYAS